jgi:HD-GYP domain-containing protein (c-di-GMP phosphodiesterase class II)
MHAQAAARAHVAVTLVGGAVAVAAAAAHTAPDPALALLAAAVIATELVEVAQPTRSLDPPSGSFSFSSGIHMGAVLLVSPWAGALLAAAGVLFADALRGSAWRKIGFNASAFALASLAGGFSFQLLGGQPGAVRLPGHLPALLALLAVYALVNAGLVSLAISLHSGLPAWTVLRSALHPGISLAEGAIGTCLALLAQRNPWDVVALVPLLLVTYQALARLAQLRGETARALETLATVVDERDPSTFRHSERVAEYVRALAEGLGLSPAQASRLAWAGRLHDLGKIAVDSAVLRKPGRLEEEEWEVVRRHPRLSARLLRHFSIVAAETRAIEYHHERFDGRGYYGVSDESLPAAAHLLTVADTFDAMTSDRPYRAALDEEQALAEVERGAGSQFHPLVARAFVALRRGQRLAQALSAEERRTLRRSLARSQPRDRPTRLREGAAAAAAVAGFLALAVEQDALGLALLAGSAAAIAAIRADTWRGLRLGRELRAQLEGASELGQGIQGVAERIFGRAGPRWAGIVSWDEQRLDGRLLRDWGFRSQRPEAAALTSWLVRDFDSPGEVLLSPGCELGRQGTYAAVPLRGGRGEGASGFLVLAFAGPLPRRAAVALRGCAGARLPALGASEQAPLAVAPAPEAAEAAAGRRR